VAVVFLYKKLFLQQNTTASLLELYFGGSQQRGVAVGPMGPM